MLAAGAEALAGAVLAGDETAVDALIDFVYENRRHPPYDIRGYCDRLEDALRETKQRLVKAPRLTTPSLPSPADATYVLVTKASVDRMYALCFALEREAKFYKRSGPA